MPKSVRKTNLILEPFMFSLKALYLQKSFIYKCALSTQYKRRYHIYYVDYENLYILFYYRYALLTITWE